MMSQSKLQMLQIWIKLQEYKQMDRAEFTEPIGRAWSPNWQHYKVKNKNKNYKIIWSYLNHFNKAY